jgi:hypothetical protein
MFARLFSDGFQNYAKLGAVAPVLMTVFENGKYKSPVQLARRNRTPKLKSCQLRNIVRNQRLTDEQNVVILPPTPMFAMIPMMTAVFREKAIRDYML